MMRITVAWEGLHLDKDILIPGNKIYGPNACMFIPQDINKLLVDREAARGLYPQGVAFNKREKKFRAAIRQYGETVHLGYHPTPPQSRQGQPI